MPTSIHFNRISLAEQIAGELRRMILSEELVPGQPITERDLLELFNVSRTPLREALQTVRNEGLIDISSSRRMSISQPTREDTRDRLIVLRSLEECAARLAAEKVDEKDIKELEKLQKKMLAHIAKDDHMSYFEANIQFHRLIVESTENDYLIDTHKEYDNALYRHRFLSSNYSTKRRKIASDDHGEIIDALRSRNAELAGTLMSKHLGNTLTNVEKYWQENPRQTTGQKTGQKTDKTG